MEGRSNMELKVFDVEHGACSLLFSDCGKKMMIDCGHNGDTGWRPGQYLKEQGVNYLDILAITNYDEDHASGLPDLRKHVRIGSLWRNTSVSHTALKLLKSEDGMGSGIEELANMIPNYSGGNTTPLVMQGIERKCFFLNYPEFDDENNLSMVIHLKISGIGFLFPGDLEVKGWNVLLERNQAFQKAVADTKVLIASHHGRENGLCTDIFTKYGCKPYWVVISDKGYQHDTQRTVTEYERYAIGAQFRSRERKVLTTRNDGRIRFWFNNGKWGAD